MSLSERKIRILQAIIDDYIATAEPVGSRTIAKKYDLGISSATIRNEMSDLEDMGFIFQPHASSGRIPSDLGYRLYVDHLMTRTELDEGELQFLRNVAYTNISQIDYLMEEAAKAISTITKYTTIVSEPVARRAVLKQIRLLPLDSYSALVVTATEENFIKNHIVRLREPLDDEEFYYISNIVNGSLKGLSLEDINMDVLSDLEIRLGRYKSLIPVLMKAVSATIHSEERVQLHMSGSKNILAFPEFSDIQKAKSLFQTLEEKDVLITLLGRTSNNGLQIMIGNENDIKEMQDCSVITASYRMSDTTRGSIGIIGPTRMDYSQVVSVLNTMVDNIEKVLRALAEGKNST